MHLSPRCALQAKIHQYFIDIQISFMPSSGSKSRSPHRNRRKSNSPDKGRPSKDKRSPSSSSRSSHSSRSRQRSAERGSRSHNNDKSKEYTRYPPRREIEPVQQNPKLFVTNIDSKYSQEELDREIRAIFEPFGKLKEIVIKTKQGSNNSYVFVEYDNIETAIKAQQQLRGIDFKGKELKVQFGRGQRKNDDRRSDKCYICHKEGHFAKDCRYNRYTGSDMRSDGRGSDRYNNRDRDDGRRRSRRDSRSRSPSSSDSRSHRRHSGRDRDRDRNRDRDDYRHRDRDHRRSPQKRSDYYSRRH